MAVAGGGFRQGEPTQPFGRQIFFQIPCQFPIGEVLHKLHKQTAKEPFHAIPLGPFEMSHIGHGFGAIRQIGVKPPGRVRGRDQTVEINQFQWRPTRLQCDGMGERANQRRGAVDQTFTQRPLYSRVPEHVDNARTDFDCALPMDLRNTWVLLGQGDVNT
jgi:hypothetical protein